MKKHSKEIIEATAEAIMEHFIPKDKNETRFSFYFTIPPSSNYKVNYERDLKGNWSFVSFELDEKL